MVTEITDTWNTGASDARRCGMVTEITDTWISGRPQIGRVGR